MRHLELAPMVSRVARKRHLARAAGRYAPYMSLCGKAMDYERTERELAKHGGYLRFPDCQSCADLL